MCYSGNANAQPPKQVILVLWSIKTYRSVVLGGSDACVFYVEVTFYRLHSSISSSGWQAASMFSRSPGSRTVRRRESWFRESSSWVENT